jgi:EAL and modified HD-GYP domain-containing signal transduction protein
VAGAEAAAASLAGIGARRPLLSADGAVAGFEFRLSDALIRRAAVPAQAAYTQAILTAMRATAGAGRIGLAELPASWLLKPQAGALLAPGMMVCLRREADSDDPSSLRSAVEAVRAGGARAGCLVDPPGGIGPGDRPDFLLLRPSARLPVGSMLQAVKRAAANRQRPCLVATDLPGLEVVELALENGIDFASGSLSAAGEPAEPLPVSPTIQRLCLLLNRLLRGEDPVRLADDVKRDVSLSVQLLRHVGSAHYARGRAVDTVEGAVLLMGRDGLYRWLSQVLVRSAGARPTRRAVQGVTLARARLLELLAAQRGEPHPASLFTLGLASMLPTLFETSVREALGSIELVPEARAALLETTGPWIGYLQLAIALERQDLDAADVLAQPFGGLAVVLELAEQSWAWTAEQDAAG